MAYEVVLLVLNLLVTSLLTATSEEFHFTRKSEGEFKCYRDICTEYVQYCVHEKERCFYCKDISHLCGDNRLPQRCVLFCVDYLIEKKMHLYTKENQTDKTTIGPLSAAETQETVTGDTSTSLECPIMCVIPWLLIAFVICVGLMLLTCYCIKKHNQNKQKSLTFQDPENPEEQPCIEKDYNENEIDLNKTMKKETERAIREAPIHEAPIPSAHIPEAPIPEAHIPEAHIPEAPIPEQIEHQDNVIHNKEPWKNVIPTETGRDDSKSEFVPS